MYACIRVGFCGTVPRLEIFAYSRTLDDAENAVECEKARGWTAFYTLATVALRDAEQDIGGTVVIIHP